jgi:hypothetical protein
VAGTAQTVFGSLDIVAGAAHAVLKVALGSFPLAIEDFKSDAVVVLMAFYD